MEYVLLLLQEKYSRNKEDSSPKERKEILPDEANAIRYVAGYVINKKEEKIHTWEVIRDLSMFGENGRGHHKFRGRR